MSSAHFVIRNISMAERNHSLLSFRVEGECYNRLQPTGSFLDPRVLYLPRPVESNKTSIVRPIMTFEMHRVIK